MPLNDRPLYKAPTNIPEVAAFLQFKSHRNAVVPAKQVFVPLSDSDPV